MFQNLPKTKTGYKQSATNLELASPHTSNFGPRRRTFNFLVLSLTANMPTGVSVQVCRARAPRRVCRCHAACARGRLSDGFGFAAHSAGASAPMRARADLGMCVAARMCVHCGWPGRMHAVHCIRVFRAPACLSGPVQLALTCGPSPCGFRNR